MNNQYNSTGAFGIDRYGPASGPQHIASLGGAAPQTGGDGEEPMTMMRRQRQQRRSQRNKSQRNKSLRGGKRKSQRRNKSQRNNKSRRNNKSQRGGK